MEGEGEGGINGCGRAVTGWMQRMDGWADGYELDRCVCGSLGELVLNGKMEGQIKIMRERVNWGMYG